ncbi:heat-inducible transcriptional repressor HrcA [Xanthomonas translucens pv. undulosa]|uniref:heat-inducible transcriptional repressor HrcA n=1 Tax=Xanthomonas campestris pv. translucens TaxID=343 RepID=UPI00071E7EFC|nr:heat-inducible transcriptional repressor HrcA [Xanthomonas translucens]AVY67001.1 HrcA family transcriptional regulator [Xanthomonas translucens pv. undulosa]QSQ40642.1 heat-inducible transcriptional repressor HrcA [Xanthomonas translucens pv. translucens]QSQ48162.1 heat-inducible transcriptional repressor HrcA [Xanthomonas translucens pv. undulosa]QSQ53862.1 heat-inducible transcriptional repressor HrcA [Xanthomonas translucens pv. undulosa]QSQ60517.1 heat-inducible transcriptional repress
MRAYPVHSSLDPRARQLLRTLISRYIRDGEPVGSQTLARHAGLDLSPATIRNILADLEDAGLLSSPHTSAGRIPTATGYRVFVDSLVQMRPPGEGEVARLRAEMSNAAGTQALLGSASELLSAMTHFVGVVSAPKREQFAFRHIDFVPLDARRVLAILVFADNEVQNRVIEPRKAYEPAELERVANYLNAHFAGRALADIRASLVRDLRHARDEMELLLAHSVELAEQALAPVGDDMVLAGQTKLMGVQDLSDLERLRELFEIFASKREILQLLERTIRAPGVRIFIGEETGVVPLESVSLVTAPYMAGGQVLGVLGVIGPKRMDYDRVIPLVQTAAEVLGAALDPTPPSER